MTLDADKLRSSLELVLERAPDLSARFYETLFARYPVARPLFAHVPMRRQEEMLTRALVAVVDHVEDAAWLREQLFALGARHASYGIRPEMYDWVGAALLATLGEVAGDEWTADLNEQWTEAYGVIVALMRAGEAAALDGLGIAAPVELDAAPASH